MSRQNPFLYGSELSDDASSSSDNSIASDIALNSFNRQTEAFSAHHGEHVHNSRQAVYSHSAASSISQSYTSSRASSSLSYPHALRDLTAVQAQPDPDFSPFGGYPVSSFPLHMHEKEPDDYMHNPDPILDAKPDPRWVPRDGRGFVGFAALLSMVLGAIAVFIVLPVLTYTGRAQHRAPPEVIEYLTIWQYPILSGIRSSLIDPDTPRNAYIRRNKDGKIMNLVFSDEFNQEGRTFYDGEDQFWTAVDLHYAATQDLEWYDPDAITTANGTLVIQMDAFKNHNLFYRSGMIQSWNKLCFQGGALEVSASLPGPGNKIGYWPGIWTLGNLARPGYLATSDGTWPYSYDSCDVGITPNQSSTDGISYLPGQRLNSCTCSGEDHPNPGVGRGAPEIDALEAANSNINPETMIGVASQSLQVAPMDVWYRPNYDFIQIYNSSVTTMNTYAGGPFQQAVSAVSTLNNEWYDNKSYQNYGFEYEPGKGSGYIQWQVGDEPTHLLDGRALGPNGNINIRPITYEPLTMVINFGISNSWAYIDWQALPFPNYMRIDHVRIYQLEGSEAVTCDPKGYPTTDYIQQHREAYYNPNYTSWEMAGYKRPKNKIMDKCKV
ncbi:beta-glucan synthesis-associated [Lipomyces arxii]|uniref:beta-glucan synthesis-associated n=1 Tax=Lipomyces arxii TaxID=56418 RepID=UPI0034CFCEA6